MTAAPHLFEGSRRQNCVETIRRHRSMRVHCCDRMTKQVQSTCADHLVPANCPDSLIAYWPRFDEYGIRVRDGGGSVIAIKFCPWCGLNLPPSRRDEWFDRLRDLGIDDPGESPIPTPFQSDAWYRDRSVSKGPSRGAQPRPEAPSDRIDHDPPN